MKLPRYRSWPNVVQLILSNDKASAGKALMQDVVPKQTQWRGTLRSLIELEKTTMHDKANQAESSYAQLRVAMIGAAFAALIVGVIGALLITRSILKQLGAEPSEAQRVAGEIADGNLSVPVVIARGASGSLMASLETMRAQLSSIVAGSRHRPIRSRSRPMKWRRVTSTCRNARRNKRLRLNRPRRAWRS
jgi:methyl-accepting chemotaxis protein